MTRTSSLPGPGNRQAPRWARVCAAVGHSVRARPAVWPEGVVVVWLLWLYDAINNLPPIRSAAAMAHARSVLQVEIVAHIDSERSLNHFVARHHLIALLLASYYNLSHFVVTFGLLGAVWLFRPDHYRPLRTTLVVINLIGFAVFWVYPMAPPRMLPGFVDVVATTGASGSFHTGAMASAANQLAAMPSLHVAWAVWSALAVWTCTHHRIARVAAACYPILTFITVLATANHLIIDSVAGVVTALLAASVTRQWMRVDPIDTDALSDLVTEDLLDAQGSGSSVGTQEAPSIQSPFSLRRA